MHLIIDQKNHLKKTNLYKSKLINLLSGTDLELFSYFIFSQIAPLISISNDLSKNNYELDCDEKYIKINFGYKNMLMGGKVVNPHFFTLLIERKKDDKLYKIKSFSYKILKILQLKNYKNISLVTSENELMQSSKFKNKFTINLLPILLNKKNYNFKNFKLSEQIFNLTMSFINQIFPKADNKNIKEFIFKLIGIIYSDIDKMDKLNFKNVKILYCGTGGYYFNILASYIANKNNIQVTRFAHGLDRVFFLDDFWDYELKGINNYVNFSDFSNINLQLSYSKFIKFDFNKSNYYEKIFNNRTQYYKNYIKKRYILIGQSYLGEARQMRSDKLLDRNQLILEKNIIHIFRKIGLDISYKPHPKGHSDKNILKNYLDVEFAGGDLIETFRHSEYIIFTSIGTAAIEAILSGKKVFYIDCGIRPKSDLFHYLQKVIKVISIEDMSNINQLEDTLKRNIFDFKINREAILNFYNLFFYNLK